MTYKSWLLAGAVALFVAPAQANIISVSPSGGSTGVNVISNACVDHVAGPASIITGCLNNDHNPSGDVNFFSNESVQFHGGGQARVEAADGAAGTLTIDPVNFFLDELILNIHANANGFVKFCDNSNCSSVLSINGNGQNFFDIQFNLGADFLNLSTFSDAAGLNSAQLIDDTRQWRLAISGAPPCSTNCGPPPGVPEPGTLWLLAVGLLGLGAFGRLRQQKRI
jgi:hypothetical protein